jgi:hypothetical protein
MEVDEDEALESKISLINKLTALLQALGQQSLDLLKLWSDYRLKS